MKQHRYLIIGGGMTAASAVKGIRDVDAEGSIGLIGSEAVPPYDRPPLTKGLWKGKDESVIWRDTKDRQATLHLGRLAISIDPDAKTVMDDQGDEYQYERLLLATGGTPRELPFGGGQILYYRTYEDYLQLRDLVEKKRGKRFAVIGGGFIGSELAAALAMNGQEVTILFPGPGICHALFPAALVEHINAYYERKGLRVLAGARASALSQQDGVLTLSTEQGRAVEVDHVVAGLGIQPNTQLAEALGLPVKDGIEVGEDLQTSLAGIYAAGDVAAYPSSIGYGHRRVEHEDNANAMGRQAGRNMAGQASPYTHIPMFYSDLFDLGYEAVGRLDSSLELVEDWQADGFEKGVVYYLDEGQLRGVLLWNVWDKVDAARELLRDIRPKTEKDLIGRL